MSETFVPGIYQHYKGAYYLALGVAAHSETEERLVVYVPLYASPGPRLWARPLAMFQERIERNGESLPRFRYIGQELPADMSRP